MVKADPKPSARVRDLSVFREFYGFPRECVCCGIRRGEAHHLIHRSQSGDDVMGNLIPLCGPCHRAYHGTSYHSAFYQRKITGGEVKSQIARFVRGESGEYHRAYLIAKLGMYRAEAFVQRLEGKL